MVMAASLSQVQTLLHKDTLRSKRQLLDTFDRALTGCRVVYACLEEEVRDLVAQTHADELTFKDRARFLWKEETFKELLTQIRGQQSALSLLIQGLQMESITDIKKLVQENSVTLDQVVKQSRTLRQKHPGLRVPESLFQNTHTAGDAADAESIIKSTHFTFDDDVVHSKAYRRAMELYISATKFDPPTISAVEINQDSRLDFEPSPQDATDGRHLPLVVDGITAAVFTREDPHPESPQLEPQLSVDTAVVQEDCESIFESIKKDYLPYMPLTITPRPFLGSLRANSSEHVIAEIMAPLMQTPMPSLSEDHVPCIDETPPPLPPRRSGGTIQHPSIAVPGPSRAFTEYSESTINTSIATSAFSNVSIPSSITHESTDYNHAMPHSVVQNALSLRKRTSNDITASVSHIFPKFDSSGSMLSLRNAQMHEVWQSLIIAEQSYHESMFRLRNTFYDNVLRQWPLLRGPSRRYRHVFLPVMEQQISDSEEAVCDPNIFGRWVNQVYKSYREYCQCMPHTSSSLRTTQAADPKFGPFVNTLGLSLVWFGMGWEPHLKLPMMQIELYINKLKSIICIAEASHRPAVSSHPERLKSAVAAVEWLQSHMSTVLQKAEQKEEIQSLEKRIKTLNNTILSRLHLRDSKRRVSYQGPMVIKLKSQGTWQSVHVMLLDNFLLWGKVKRHKVGKRDRILVYDDPIPVTELDIITPHDDHQFQKATIFDNTLRGTVLYVITVKTKSSKPVSHMLGAFSYVERKAWLDHFAVATDHQAGP
ncbi:hypothetical protein ACEQ8H_000290 [Pleosporales sp. CAS-2024a]